MEQTEFKAATLICVNCRQAFTFTAGEQRFYWSKGLAMPKRCPECRMKRKLTLGRQEVGRDEKE